MMSYEENTAGFNKRHINYEKFRQHSEKLK